jgi:hypothetical protein
MKKSAAIFALFVSFACAILAPGARAQFIGYTSPQTVQQTLAPDTTFCTGSPQNYPVQNLGQTQHSVTLTVTSPAQKLNFQILGTDGAGNTFPISPNGVTPQIIMGASAVISGYGYFPKVVVTITCSPNTASYGLQYAGSAIAPPPLNSAYMQSQIDQLIFNGLPGSANQNFNNLFTPFGNSSGYILAQFVTSSVANSLITVTCASFSGATLGAYSYTMQNELSVQLFTVPPGPCVTYDIGYTSGGGGAGNITVDYVFNAPGLPVNTTLATYTHVTTTTATPAKATPGTLTNLAINTAAAGTISIFDLTGTNCVGTPATNVVAVITVNATDTAHTIPYNLAFINGVCTKASAAMDYTVGTQ